MKYIKRLWRYSLVFLVFSVLNALTTSIFYVEIVNTISEAAVGNNDLGVLGIIKVSLQFIVVAAIVFLGYFLFKNLFLQNVLKEIRFDYIKSVLDLSPEIFLKKNISNYSLVLSKEIEEIKTYYLKIYSMIIDGISLITVLIYAYLRNELITITTLLMSVVLAIIPIILQKKLALKNVEYYKKWEGFNTVIDDHIGSYDITRIYQKEKYVCDNFSEKNTEIAECAIGVEFLSSYIQILVMILIDAMVFIMLGFAAYYILAGEMPASFLLVLSSIVMKITSTVNDLIFDFSEFRKTRPIYKQVMKIIDYKEDKHNEDEVEEFEKVELKDVSFGYDEKKDIIKHVDLKVDKGDFVVITGESGSGKSTITKLILGYFTPKDGNILYNNRKIDLNSRGYLNQFAVIFQNTAVFEASLYDNVTLFQDIEEGKVINALRRAGLGNFIEKLPDGIKTIIREDGSNISGGERQRIAIARAILSERAIFVLDEATSSLDQKTAIEIEREIAKLDGCTIIMITHHAHEEIMRKCNKFYQINNGTLKQVENRYNCLCEQKCVE